jgi:pyridoxal phosphate enzyme (YggS family)
MSFAALPERLAQVRAEIARQQAAGGWTHPVTIVAVTQGFGLDAVTAAFEAGLADIGENRVQEALDKLETMDRVAAPGIRWHLIGHLQRNKAKLVPGRFALVHSVDSLELAEELNRRTKEPLQVLLQVNVAREPQKSGCEPEQAPELARQMAALGKLHLDGLMTLAPLTDDEDVQRRTFRSLRALRDTIKEEGLWLPTLSMGMSADYATAVAEGATVIRLGTVLFGSREKETTP